MTAGERHLSHFKGVSIAHFTLDTGFGFGRVWAGGTEKEGLLESIHVLLRESLPSPDPEATRCFDEGQSSLMIGVSDERKFAAVEAYARENG
jgi:hypothetical protein